MSLGIIWVAFFSRCQRYRCRQVTQNLGVSLLMAIVHAGGVEGSVAAYRPAWLLVIVLQALTVPLAGLMAGSGGGGEGERASEREALRGAAAQDSAAAD